MVLYVVAVMTPETFASPTTSRREVGDVELIPMFPVACANVNAFGAAVEKILRSLALVSKLFIPL